MKKLKILILTIGTLFMVSSCEDFFDQLEDPNNLTPDQGNVNFILNNIQLNFPGLFNAFSAQGAQLVRMNYMSGFTYDNAFTPVTFNGVYSSSYTDILVEADNLIPIAEESRLWVHAGIAKLLKAYVMMTLVDWFGETPYSEALDPTNLNPQLDNGDAIYDAALALINEAIVNFENEDRIGLPATDFYYNGNVDRWIKFANTMKLKYHLTTRLVNNGATAAINSLITEGNLIETAEESFAFRYSTNALNPDSRHPAFIAAYINLPQLGNYVSNYYMYAMRFEKPMIDPRIRYYFVRQTDEISTDTNEISCIDNQAPDHYPANTPFCAVGDGYWGRDHGNQDGIPPDGFLRSVRGVYPAGGRFDGNQFVAVAQSQGLQGAGIQPIMMNSFVDFMLAESALVLGTSGSARDYLESGVRKSISYVMNFGSSVAVAAFIPTTADVDDYVDHVLTQFDNSVANRPNIIAKEYYLALWGNGIEAYNMYRRTTLPNNLQPHLNPTPGVFYRTFPYASNLVDRNNNVTTKANGASHRVFWDTNPDGLLQ